MSLTHTTAIRNGLADYVVDAIDVGGAGTFEFQTSGDVEVATLTFSATAFGDAASGVATANAITSDTSATGGAVAKFRIYSGGATEIVAGSVAVSGEDVDISSVVIASGETVAITSLTYTASP
jgi:hypothetical protein